VVRIGRRARCTRSLEDRRGRRELRLAAIAGDGTQDDSEDQDGNGKRNDRKERHRRSPGYAKAPGDGL
jgi:hypothetical protein